MSTYREGPVYAGPPAPYPAVEGDPVTEQWWWDRLRTHPYTHTRTDTTPAQHYHPCDSDSGCAEWGLTSNKIPALTKHVEPSIEDWDWHEGHPHMNATDNDHTQAALGRATDNYNTVREQLDLWRSRAYTAGWKDLNE